MTKPSHSSAPKCLFLTPEDPTATGGGALRAASLLAYLRTKYSVDVVGFALDANSRSPMARVWRNTRRLMRNVPPLFDRYSGYEGQLARKLSHTHYSVAVVEHFWCASYAPLLRKYCDRLVVDLVDIESALAHTHAEATRWPASWASERFARAYQQLEDHWLPQFDIVLVTSPDDASRVSHPEVHVCANTMPERSLPNVPEENCIVFSGNMEYHPNVEAVRWFHSRVWPRVRRQCPDMQWRLIGKNPQGVAKLVSGDPRIVLTGAIEDAVTEIAKGKVCIVPLLSGSGTRYKILEAWATARAVVSTAIGAEGLGAQDGEDILIADHPDDFAASVVRLYKDAGERARLGLTGRTRYLKHFTWSAVFRQLEQAGL